MLSKIILIIVLIISIIILLTYVKDDRIYVKANDNNIYYVRDLPDKQDAANMLAKLKENIFTLSNKLNNTNNKYSAYMKKLNEEIKDCEIYENSGNSPYTSYSVNKGEKIVFCLRSKKDNSIYDINLLMYVALHEISHIACPEYGHTALFKKIFAYITDEAIKMSLYTKIDFNNHPEEYCGMMITESII
jgi:hypothetical protein